MRTRNANNLADSMGAVTSGNSR